MKSCLGLSANCLEHYPKENNNYYCHNSVMLTVQEQPYID